jgi:hypothetical protein
MEDLRESVKDAPGVPRSGRYRSRLLYILVVYRARSAIFVDQAHNMSAKLNTRIGYEPHTSFDLFRTPNVVLIAEGNILAAGKMRCFEKIVRVPKSFFIPDKNNRNRASFGKTLDCFYGTISRTIVAYHNLKRQNRLREKAL